MIVMDFLKKRWYVFIVIIGVIVLLLFWSGYFSFLGGESFSTLRLYEMNVTAVPQGHIISLTEDDLKKFPQLALIIREKNQKPTVIDKNGTRSYEIPLSSNEMNRFNARYWSNSSGEDRRIFEYNGDYYEFDVPQIH